MMFREMRRFKQALSDERICQILEKGSTGVLALLGDEGYPYTVPINYSYINGKVYFHSAVEGHKIDAIRSYNKASFCVVAEDTVLPEKFATHYESVVAFGKIRILENDEDKMMAIKAIAQKYSPNETEERTMGEIKEFWKRMAIIELEVEQATGKKSLY